jgi:hypothetical protein
MTQWRRSSARAGQKPADPEQATLLASYETTCHERKTTRALEEPDAALVDHILYISRPPREGTTHSKPTRRARTSADRAKRRARAKKEWDARMATSSLGFSLV